MRRRITNYFVRRCAPLLMLGLATLGVLAEGIPEPFHCVYGVITNVTTSGPVRYSVGTLIWTNTPNNGGPSVVIAAALTNFHDQFCYFVRIPCESLTAPLTNPSPGSLRIASPPVIYDRSAVWIDGRPARFVLTPQKTLSLTTTDRGRIERVDLLLSFDPDDYDQNGIADTWEEFYFQRIGIDPNGDPDHDGMSNRSEYVAGTNPTDAQSAFKFINVSRLPNGSMQVDWASQNGKRYTLMRSPSLLAPMADYQVVASNILASPPANSYLDAPGTSAVMFYRIRVDQ